MRAKADIDRIAVANWLPSRTHIDVRLSNQFLKTFWTHWPDGSVLSLCSVIVRAPHSIFSTIRNRAQPAALQLHTAPPRHNPTPRPPHPDSGQAHPHADILPWYLTNIEPLESE